MYFYLKESFDIPLVELKEIIASFYTVIAEFARHNFDTVSVRYILKFFQFKSQTIDQVFKSSFLEDSGFSNEKINVFSQFYQVTFSYFQLKKI